MRLIDINIPLPRVGALCHAPGDDSTEEDDSNEGEVQQADRSPGSHVDLKSRGS
jgi:hypothetical protein